MAPKKNAPPPPSNDETEKEKPEKLTPKEKAVKAASEKAMSPLERARQALKKTLDEDHSVPLSDEMLKTTMPHVTTGSVVVDYLIGGRPNQFGIPPCPGWPRGRISNLYGNSGAGKTTLALTTAAMVCSAGGTVCYIDWENEVEPRYAAALGVPINDRNKFDLQQPNTLEDGMKIMVQMACSGVDLIVVDSVGAGVPSRVFNRDASEEGDQVRPGLNAQLWSQFLPKFKNIISKSNSTVIGISQLRKTLNTMGGGGPDSAPQGGEAWKYYSAVRMMLRVFSKQKTKKMNGITGKVEEMVTGAIVVAKLDKCKVSDSVHQEQMFYLRSGSGIDNTKSVLDLAVNYGIVTKRGSWHDWHGGPNGTVTGNGMEAFQAKMLEDPSYIKIIFAQVAPKLGSAPVVQIEEPVAEDTDSIDDIFSIVPGHETLVAAPPEDEPDLS